MRRIAFIIYFVGMFILVFSTLGDFREIESAEQLQEAGINEKVVVEGIVGEVRDLYEDTRLLVLDNGVEVLCECRLGLEGEEIKVEGFAEDYKGNKQVNALKVET